MAQLSINMRVRNLFGCSLYELSEACWEVITSSNDYFKERKGSVVSIEEINHADLRHRDTFGVVPYERNFAIGYRMYNRDCSPCSTYVYWTSLNGGLLCHGTNSFKPFKTKIKTIPCVEMLVTLGSSGKGISRRVLFGGTLPTLEEKDKLIRLIMKKKGIDYYCISIHPEEIRHILRGARSHYISCTEFIRRMLKGRYNINTKEDKSISKLEYLGLGGKNFTTITGREEPLGIYKVTYTDGTKDYKKQFTFVINRI